MSFERRLVFAQTVKPVISKNGDVHICRRRTSIVCANVSRRYAKEQAVISETSGKFKRVLLLAGCDSIAEAYAKVCNSAISGLGTDCKALIREAYSRLYGQDLVEAGGRLF